MRPESEGADAPIPSDEGLAHRHLGRIDYDEAWAIQHELRRKRLTGEGPDVLLTLEHPSVFTAGRRARPEHLRADPELLAAAGHRIRHVERGGDWTWHGPGQLVAYPIVDLTARRIKVPVFVGVLEAALAETARLLLKQAGLAEVPPVGARTGFPGLWVSRSDGPLKVGAVGIHVEGGVSMHGVALNLRRGPWGFDHIVPCGLADDPTGALADLVPPAPDEAPWMSIEGAGQLFAAALRGSLPGAGAPRARDR